jgi:hypothetical protein
VRRLSLIESAVAACLLGSIVAVAVPAFVRDVESSRLVEPVSGLERLATRAVAHAVASGAYPETAPWTPAVPPRGTTEVDPEGTWDHPTWRALDFRAAPEGRPHAYAFSFERTASGFTARAQGDLDGDGLFSLFEVRGVAPPGGTPSALPGMYVERELE